MSACSNALRRGLLLLHRFQGRGGNIDLGNGHLVLDVPVNLGAAATGVQQARTPGECLRMKRFNCGLMTILR